jgi:hypothetical protein
MSMFGAQRFDLVVGADGVRSNTRHLVLGNIETITFSENSATAESITASSGSGSVSMSTASAQTLSETVSINFSTGEIELQGSAASMKSTQLNVSA